MLVAHNLMAMNASRQYGIVNKTQQKSARKLSSGYKVNIAADDAAGLAISEKMRRQIRGLTQASSNCQDGIGFVQVADGAMNEMADIMQRMNELSVKAANDTMTTEDRGAIQSEINALIEELDRIREDTTFNGIPVLKRKNAVSIDTDNYAHAPFDEQIDIGAYGKKNAKAVDFGGINAKNKDMLADKSFSVYCSANCGQEFKFNFTKGGGSSATVTGGTATRPNVYVVVDLDEPGITDGISIAQKIFDLVSAQAIQDAIPQKGGTGGTYIGHVNGVDLQGSKLVMYATGGGNAGYISATGLNDPIKDIQIQAGSEEGQVIKLKLFDVGAFSLGVNTISVMTQADASAAINSIKGGLSLLSEYRSYYGAMQNRLEHTIKNLDNVVENTTAAESQIRDTDMAKEMVAFSNNNILLQAGTTMMSQANQANQIVLSLLK